MGLKLFQIMPNRRKPVTIARAYTPQSNNKMLLSTKNKTIKFQYDIHTHIERATTTLQQQFKHKKIVCVCVRACLCVFACVEGKKEQ